MAWDNSHIWRAAELVKAVDSPSLNTLLENPRYIKGNQPSQTEVDFESELAPDAVRFAVSPALLKKKFTGPATSGVFAIQADNSTSPSSIENGHYSGLQARIGQSGSGTEETLGDVQFRRKASGPRGEIRIYPYASSAPILARPALCFDDAGRVAIGSFSPTATFYVNGTLNVSGDYYLNGSLMSDWSVAAGKASWLAGASIGNAKVTGRLRTTALSGAPWVVSSTTECPNANADLLDGFGWHRGICEVDDYTGTDDDCADLTLDRAGVWLCVAMATGQVEASPGTVAVSIRDAADALIGNVAEFDGAIFEEFSVLCVGFYTSAAGNETLHVNVLRNWANTVSINSVRFIAIWRGP